MMNYRRRTEPIIIPYPYLTETTDLAVSGVSNVSIPVPSSTSLNQWYTASANTTITLSGGVTILSVRVQDGSQAIRWEQSGTGTTETIEAGDHFVIVSGLPLITIAGFDLMALGDRYSMGTNNGVILFPSNIGFRFIESN